METHEEINRRLRQLWKDTLEPGPWPPALDKLWPIQYPPLRSGAVLFVGLNPSADLEHPVVKEYAPDLRIERASQLDDERIASRVLELEAEARRRHPFFRPFNELAPDGNWEHLDVFAVRATQQNVLKEALQLDQGGSHFARRQFRVFVRAVEQLQPMAIVVVNALASELIQRGGPVPDNCFHEEKGYHVWSLRGRPTPVFFSGMLTGQRALDRYSRDRLGWHIRWALKAAERLA
ncbi:MAG: hypothetical protein AB1609_09010 [Bacillota bacterium]